MSDHVIVSREAAEMAKRAIALTWDIQADDEENPNAATRVWLEFRDALQAADTKAWDDYVAALEDADKPDLPERLRDALVDDDGPVLLGIREAISDEVVARGWLDREGDPLHYSDPTVEELGDYVSDRTSEAIAAVLRKHFDAAIDQPTDVDKPDLQPAESTVRAALDQPERCGGLGYRGGIWKEGRYNERCPGCPDCTPKCKRCEDSGWVCPSCGRAKPACEASECGAVVNSADGCPERCEAQRGATPPRDTEGGGDRG